ncbi:MAG: hypothetical protein ABIR26_06485 [Ramlibacter sp.]
MTSDPPPLNAFARDSASPGAAIAVDACTLTMQPAMEAERPAMGIVATFAGLPLASAETLHASVVPADHVALTITF